jgi:hypothetical protein
VPRRACLGRAAGGRGLPRRAAPAVLPLAALRSTWPCEVVLGTVVGARWAKSSKVAAQPVKLSLIPSLPRRRDRVKALLHDGYRPMRALALDARIAPQPERQGPFVPGRPPPQYRLPEATGPLVLRVLRVSANGGSQNSYLSMTIGSLRAAAIHSCIAGSAIMVSQ